MRRHTLGSKKPGRRNRALPSNNIILTLGLIAIITALMCLIGADYIVPTSSTLNFADSFRKRAAASSTAPGYTISKSFWTLGSRFGFIAFALMPLVVLLALKSPPVGFLSLRALTQLYADKLAMLHRGVGWLVWAVTTVHVALWSVQLFEDSRNGRATWFFLWTNYRFIFGCVAYFALTAVMVLSLRPIRKNGYEVGPRVRCSQRSPRSTAIADDSSSTSPMSSWLSSQWPPAQCTTRCYGTGWLRPAAYGRSNGSSGSSASHESTRCSANGGRRHC